ncbi:FMN-binding protein [Ruminococcus sp. HUN007]|uniref:FMN-binding protein n=1 Tax=Ruminococcus sp. HUN007 TaxID=1514668 RepID=UPI0005D23768|nr:FMN-binding protein [Ruminococcus sp. HUN007]
MPDKIKGPLVLTVICTVISALLIFVHEKTYVDTTGIITDDLKAGLEEIYGEGEYTMLRSPDGNVLKYDGVDSVIVKDDGSTAFEVTADGYARNGIHVLVGVNEDGITGISFIDLAETPGVGTRIRDDKKFIKQFTGISDESFSPDVLTGATLSSKGMKRAADSALNAYTLYRNETEEGGTADEQP